VNFIIKPLGIITTIVALVLGIIKILEFMGIIKP